MKVTNIKNIEGFFNTVDSCKGKVELVTGEGDRLDKNFKEHALMRAEHFEQLVDDWAVGKTHKYATYEINAACWLLPEKIIREIGGFNPMFFHYAEDINYLHRLHYHHRGA